MQEIMILGTFHFKSAGNRDQFKFKSYILSDQRQQEVLKLVKVLAHFKPTKIAVEDTQECSDQLWEEYQAYLHREKELGISEVYQLGFRLAEHMGHDRLHCVDWNMAVPGVGSVFQWMADHPSEHVEELNLHNKERFNQEQQHMEDSTLLEHFIYMNRPEHCAAGHQTYLEFAKLDDGPWPVGAGWVGQYWYYRNLRIWKNTTALFQEPDERVLLLIGAGHVHLLSQFFREAGQVSVVDTVKVLSKN